MLFVKIGLVLLVIVAISAILDKTAEVLLIGIPLFFIPILIGIVVSTYPGFYDIQEETKDLVSLNNESYYRVESYEDPFSSTQKYIICVVDNDEISHIEELNYKNIKIEYSTVATNGQLIVKYFKLKSKWEHKMFGILNGTKSEIILRLPEAEKEKARLNTLI